jgi:hypothetical protein
VVHSRFDVVDDVTGLPDLSEKPAHNCSLETGSPLFAAQLR